MPAIVVTGSTDGIGLEVVRQLLARGAEHIVVHARSEARGRPIVEALRARNRDRRIDLAVAELSSLAQVAAMAARLLERLERISVLVNNAGVGTATPRVRTGDGFDVTWQVNYLAPVLLTRLLLDRLLASRPARVVNVSSAAQAMGGGIHFDDLDLVRRSYPRMEAYCQSKLAMVMWTYDLAEELAGRGVTVNALHPGTYVDTKMVRQSVGTPWMGLAEGARPVLRLAEDEDVRGVTGKYFDMLEETSSAPTSYDREARSRLRAVTAASLAPWLASGDEAAAHPS